MKRELSHDDAFVLLDAAAMDVLDAGERDAVLSHAETCDICRPELQALRETVSTLAFVAPRTANDGSGSRERIRSRLMDRVASDGRSRGAAPLRLEESRRVPPMNETAERKSRELVISSLAWRRAEWVAAAASVLLVVSIGVLAAMFRDRQTIHDALQAELARGAGIQSASDSLRALVASRDSMITGLIGRDVTVMNLTATGTKAPFARMFWDAQRNTWTLVAHNMPELKAGRTYQLWLLTRTAKISAGTFDPTNGEAVVRATYPLARDSLQAIAITEEPAGGVPQPTGAIVIAAFSTDSATAWVVSTIGTPSAFSTGFCRKLSMLTPASARVSETAAMTPGSSFTRKRR